MLIETYYEQNKDKLTAVLARYSNDQEAAADAVQVAFLKALQNTQILSNMQEKSLWSWLYTTAKNALIDEKRKTARNDPLDGYDRADTADDFIDTVAIQDLLHKLPPNLIHIVSLRYYGGLNATEIGSLKKIPPATVRSQLRAAITILRKYID